MNMIRPDLVDAQQSFIASLGTAGTWWDGSERAAIARGVRTARTFTEAPPWATPESLGVDAAEFGLDHVVLATIWRLTNHPATLTSEWYESMVDATCSALDCDRSEVERRHVELVSIVAAMNAIDRFADALGTDRPALPAPDRSRPSRHVVDATVDRHWVPTNSDRGANVFKALTSVPSALAHVESLSDVHYVPGRTITGDRSWNRGTLSRSQIELVAAMTSLQNECFY
ncbi:MAG: hypothetical protein AB8G14_00325 [Ilumatobacter sp.]